MSGKRVVVGVAIVAVATLLGFLAKKIVFDDDPPEPPPPQETSVDLQVGGGDLVKYYEEIEHLQCRYPPELFASAQPVTCRGVVSNAAVTVSIYRPDSLLPYVVVVNDANPARISEARKATLASSLIRPFRIGQTQQEDATDWISRQAKVGGQRAFGRLRVLLPQRRDQTFVLTGRIPGRIASSTPIEPLLELAERFAPILRFAAAEKFFPLRVDGYLKEADLCSFRPRRGPGPAWLERVTTKLDVVDCKPAPPLDELPTTKTPPNCPDCFWALQVRGATETDGDATWIERDGAMRDAYSPPHSVYYALRPIGGQRSILEYWLFYAFNHFSNLHEGDWEVVGVELKHLPHGSEARRVIYSAHHGRTVRGWTELLPGQGRTGDHPVVYVAAGSHANYFEPGPHMVYERLWRWSGRVVCGKGKDSTDDLRRVELRFGDYDLIALGDEGGSFTGGYGPANYLAGAQIDAGKPPTEDPRHSDAWERPFEFVAARQNEPCHSGEIRAPPGG
jgi:hypothetical protein